MGYVVLLVTVGVTIYALVDCWRSADDQVRALPRPAWIMIIAVFWLVGGLAYLIFGRESGVLAAARNDRPRVMAPDDDPDFLLQLDVEQRRAAAERRRTREQQERREQERREQQERRERKERERLERQQRKDRKADPGEPAGPESADGDDHSDHPSS